MRNGKEKCLLVRGFFSPYKYKHVVLIADLVDRMVSVCVRGDGGGCLLSKYIYIIIIIMLFNGRYCKG